MKKPVNNVLIRYLRKGGKDEKEKVRKLTPFGKFVRILIGMVMIAAIVYMYLQMGKEIKTTFSLHGDVKSQKRNC